MQAAQPGRQWSVPNLPPPPAVPRTQTEAQLIERGLAVVCPYGSYVEKPPILRHESKQERLRWSGNCATSLGSRGISIWRHAWKCTKFKTSSSQAAIFCWFAHTK